MGCCNKCGSVNIPKGPKGDTGPQGPQGPAGTNGTNGTNGQDGEVIDAAVLAPIDSPSIASFSVPYTQFANTNDGYELTIYGASDSGSRTLTVFDATEGANVAQYTFSASGGDFIIRITALRNSSDMSGVMEVIEDQGGNTIISAVTFIQLAPDFSTNHQFTVSYNSGVNTTKRLFLKRLKSA